MFTFTAAEDFWKSFHALSNEHKALVREKWQRFKLDPFDRSLRTHTINRLTALYRTTVYSVVIAGNLRVIFIIKGERVITMDVGTHDIYK